MASLARDAQFGPSGVKAIARRVVILMHIRGVAFRAHEVPILVETGPMQDIAVADRLIGIKMEPALTARVSRPRVPGDRQRLKPPVGKSDQILLEREHAEGVGDLEIAHAAVAPVRVDEKSSIPTKEV